MPMLLVIIIRVITFEETFTLRELESLLVTQVALTFKYMSYVHANNRFYIKSLSVMIMDMQTVNLETHVRMYM